MSVVVYAAIVVLAGAGALLRFLIDSAVSTRLGRGFPFGTLVVNVSGAVLAGLIVGLAPSHDTALLAGTAAVGSYTTFSTWLLESQRLGEGGQGPSLAANLAASLILGIAAAALGRLLGSHL